MWNADPANIADYLQLFAAYHDDLTKSLEARINAIIGDESRRTGKAYCVVPGPSTSSYAPAFEA